MAGEAAVYAPTFPGPPCHLCPPAIMSAPMWSGPLYIVFCAEDLGGGQALGSGAAGAGPQPSRSLLCREGGDRIKLQLAWWITWPPRKSCNQSPVFLRDVPGAEKGPTRVCLQRQGVGLLGFSNVHHPAPFLLAFRSSPRATAWLGLLDLLPHGSRVALGPALSTDVSCVTREGMAASATAKWPRLGTG